MSGSDWAELDPGIGDLVEFTTDHRPGVPYRGYYKGYVPQRDAYLVTAKKTGQAGWLVEGENFVRIIEAKKGRKSGWR